MPQRPEVVDLFCGAGGLTLGSHNAGFVTRSAFDVDGDLTSNFNENFPAASLYRIDLDEASAGDVAALVGGGRVAGVIGGPPCQGFSEIGRRQQTDPRNALVGRFMAVVAKLRPKFFLMENVPGLGHDRYSTILERALDQIPSTYTVLEKLSLNAADYGAATDRSRMVVLGYDPSCVDALTSADIFNACVRQNVTVRDAIRDLPAPTASDECESLEYVDDAPISTYAAQMRCPPPKGISGERARALNRQGRVTGVGRTVHTKAVVERFGTTTPGERDPISRYPRLSWDKTAPVLRAGTGRDRGSFQAARPIHPEAPRVISVREAARLQGFPDWFQFSRTKWHSHRMIGNSVSPLFAEAIMKVIRPRIDAT